ncbi:MAG: hypothetical protein U9Q38_09200, partial [Thermodesulfobacteriota bacterium]|nr:hypothetical protein [Thermodesulfobacteriota bacterium]
YEGLTDTNKYTDGEKALIDEATVLGTTATTLPSAINEVHGEVDTHVAATGAHGVTTVVGLDEVQTLTDKTLTDPSNYVHARRVEYQVKAATTEILKGTPVTVNEWNAADGVAEAVVADQSITTQYGIANAVATETIALGSVGTVIMSGTLLGLNTEGYAENQVLFVGGGTLTNVAPTSGWVQPIAKVLRDHATEGVIQVQAQAPKQDAYGVRYDNSTSGLTAVHVQGALDEVEGRLDTAETKLGGVEDNATADQLASEVPTTLNGNVSNSTVQLMLEQIMNGTNPEEI